MPANVIQILSAVREREREKEHVALRTQNYLQALEASKVLEVACAAAATTTTTTRANGT